MGRKLLKTNRDVLNIIINPYAKFFLVLRTEFAEKMIYTIFGLLLMVQYKIQDRNIVKRLEQWFPNFLNMRPTFQ